MYILHEHIYFSYIYALKEKICIYALKKIYKQIEIKDLKNLGPVTMQATSRTKEKKPSRKKNPQESWRGRRRGETCSLKGNKKKDQKRGKKPEESWRGRSRGDSCPPRDAKKKREEKNLKNLGAVGVEVTPVLQETRAVAD